MGGWRTRSGRSIWIEFKGFHAGISVDFFFSSRVIKVDCARAAQSWGELGLSLEDMMAPGSSGKREQVP